MLDEIIERCFRKYHLTILYISVIRLLFTLLRKIIVGEIFKIESFIEIPSIQKKIEIRMEIKDL